MVNVHEAKTNLSDLLRRVEQGEEIVIARAGTPIARIVPIGALAPRQPGRWSGQVWMSEDFDDTPNDLLRLFEGDLDG
jgi:prevent-host-death family protein